MAWKRSITGEPVFRQLLEDNDPAAIDPKQSAEAVENLQELGRLAAYKAFCLMDVWHETRRAHYEDAIQEAISYLWQYRTRGPRAAYRLAKWRMIYWIIEYLWHGKRRRRKEEIELRLRTCLNLGPSLDAFERQPQFISEWIESLSPEEEIIRQTQRCDREACIDTFYDIIVDLVANRMNLERRRYHTAQKDAKVFWHTLQGYTFLGIAHELGISKELAAQQIRYARRRLEAFLTEKGLEAVAEWYRGVATGEQVLDDMRAKELFVNAYVQNWCDQYQQEHGKPPGPRAKKDYKLQGRRLWENRQAQQVAAD